MKLVLCWLLSAVLAAGQSIPFPGPGGVAGAASPPIAFVTGASACAGNTLGGNTATTAAKDTTGATILIVGASYYGVAGTAAITDSKSNTWTPLTARDSGGPVAQFFYAENPIVGSGHTFTSTLIGGFPSLCFEAFAGAATSSSFDVQNGATIANSAVPTSLATGSVTPGTNGQVLVTFSTSADNGGNPLTVDLGFTITDQLLSDVMCCYAVGMGYLIETTATAKNPTWDYTVNPSSYAAAAIATFKQAP